MRTGSLPGIVEAVQVDLRRLHDGWMGLIYPNQRVAPHSVLGKWKPRSTLGLIAYRLWAAVGAPVVALLYPLVLFGFSVRFYSRRIDRVATSLGLIGVVVVSIVVWGLLSLLASLRFSAEGFLAVLGAAIVATVAAALALVSTLVDGRETTVLLAYPFGVTAIFLPPVVAALYSPFLAEVVFPFSTSLAIWLLDNLLFVGGLADYLRANYDLVGAAYVVMWFGLAIPIGWFLGGAVTLADVVRPKAR